MDVSIILVNYNTKQLTLECIDSIVNHTVGCSYEIIVVDNNSQDGSKEILESDTRILYYYQSENLGFGKANNIGFSKAKGDYILCLNTDTLLLEDSITLMFRTMKNKRIHVLGTKLVDLNGEKMHSFSVFTPSILWEFDMNCYVFSVAIELICRLLISIKGYLKVGYITGADLMMSSHVLKTCGYFDSDFFMYFEESELQKRFARNGYNAYYYPITKIIHLEGKSCEIKETRERMYLQSRKLFYDKVYGEKYRKKADALYIAFLRWGKFLNSLIGNSQKADVYNKKMQIFGTFL